MVIDTPYLAPDLRPGRSYLAGQQRPDYLIEADENYAACIEETNRVSDMLDECENDAIRSELLAACIEARNRETAAMIIAHNLYYVWQSELGML